MKQLFIFGLLICSISLVRAQDMVRKQEFQVSLDIHRGIQTLSAYYKLNFKKNQDKYWRSRIGFSDEDYFRSGNDLFQKTSKTILAFGFEKRIPPTKKSQLTAGVEIYGIDERYQAFHQDSFMLIIPNSERLGVGIAFPIGVTFNKNAKWYVGIETVPGIQFQKPVKDKLKMIPNPSRNWGFYNHSLALCFGYRIPTKRI